MTAKRKDKLKWQLGYLFTGIAILAALAAGAYWLLDAMFSDGGRGMVGPT